jgi:hypothetical protein
MGKNEIDSEYLLSMQVCLTWRQVWLRAYNLFEPITKCCVPSFLLFFQILASMLPFVPYKNSK